MSDAAAAAAEALYGGSLREFTAERARRSKELKQAGDRAAAAAVGALPRPSMSAWVVNQLWREARPDFDALFAAGARLRAGDFAATAAQRDALGRLRARAAAVLVADGHAAGETTLDRATTTLRALSAIGSFAPDPPGQLAVDRDPPGFEAMTLAPPRIEAAPSAPPPLDPEAAQRAAEAAQRAAEVAAARAREALALRLAAAVTQAGKRADQARAEATARARTVDELRVALTRAEAALIDARARVDDAERELAAAHAAVAAS